MRVAAVNIEIHQHLVQSLMSKYDFQVQGVPTIILLKPKLSAKGSMSKQRIDYPGARTAAALYKEALSHMPDYSTFVTAASLARFRAAPLPQGAISPPD